MNLYFLPASAEGLQNRLFVKRVSPAGEFPNVSFWHHFRLACEKRGVNLLTYDFWTKAKSESDDILFVLNHPGETLPWRIFYGLKYWRSRGGFIMERRRFVLQNYKFFRKRILFQGESPMVMPYVYSHLSAIKRSGLYTKIFLICRGFGDEYGYFNHFENPPPPIVGEYFNAPKTKFLTMMNSNTPPHSLVSLFGERMRAIRYFSKIPGFDFYGHGWDKIPRHPFYFWYKKYVDLAWRGTIDDKLKELSAYKFSLCFENCSWPGYVADRVYHCLAVGCVPIYLGAPDIESLVPPSCFINFRKFKNYEELYDCLKSLTETDLEKYRNSMLMFLRNKSNTEGIDWFINQILL